MRHLRIKSVRSHDSLIFIEIVLKERVSNKMLLDCTMHILELIFVFKEMNTVF